MADSTSTLRVVISGDSAGARRAFEETAAGAEATAGKIGTEMEGATSRVGGAFSRLAAIGNNWGLPFTSSLESLGSKFDEAEQKGKGFSQAMSTLGGATLLGVGAGAVAVGVEAIRMADSFDTAEASLKTAVKNAGGDFTALKPKIDAAYASMAQMGFNSTETATALAQLTTATGSPTKAMQDLQVAGDLARLKNVSLSDASGVLTKTLAGSTRALTQLGLNLDIGSAKLSSMYTASQTLQTAQQHLDEIQSRLADGSLKKTQASLDTLANAQRSVQVASENLARDQAAGGDIMDALRQKTQGAAKAYGDTLPGQVEVARAELHNLGTTIGVQLEPKLIELGRDTMDVVLWFEKHKAAAEALGVVIGGTLATAVGVFTYGKLKDLATGLKTIYTDATKLGSKLTGLFGGSSTGGVAPSTATGALGGEAGSASFAPAVASLETAGGGLQGAATALSEAAGKLDLSGGLKPTVSEPTVAPEGGVIPAGEPKPTVTEPGVIPAPGGRAAGGVTSKAESLLGAALGGPGRLAATFGLALGGSNIDLTGSAGARQYLRNTLGFDLAGAGVKGSGGIYNLGTGSLPALEKLLGQLGTEYKHGDSTTRPGIKLEAADVAEMISLLKSISAGQTKPASHTTHITVNVAKIAADNPQQLVAQLKQQSRVANLAGGAMRPAARST